MAKKTKQKTGKKEIIIIGIIVIAAIIFAFIFYNASKVPPENAIAEVNGIKILQNDLDEIALTVPPSMRSNLTNADLIEQAINFEIVRQEAEKLGIVVSNAEVDENINASLESAGLTMDDLKASIKQQNIQFETLYNAYKKQILSLKFMNETIMKNVTVSEEEMKALYNQYAGDLNVTFEDVKEDINSTIQAMKSQQVLGIWLKQKRMQYDIRRYVNGS